MEYQRPERPQRQQYHDGDGDGDDQKLELPAWFVGIIYFMPFEYDPSKSDSNRVKHGIDFEEARHLWDDEFHLEIPAKNLDEPRFLVIGKINGKHWSAVITYRGENMRIISVRRSRDEEIELYENDSL
ncbi:MAG: BrnT family toxin [Anaerolineales bacterium]